MKKNKVIDKIGIVLAIIEIGFVLFALLTCILVAHLWVKIVLTILFLVYFLFFVVIRRNYKKNKNK